MIEKRVSIYSTKSFKRDQKEIILLLEFSFGRMQICELLFYTYLLFFFFFSKLEKGLKMLMDYFVILTLSW